MQTSRVGSLSVAPLIMALLLLAMLFSGCNVPSLGTAGVPAERGETQPASDLEHDEEGDDRGQRQEQEHSSEHAGTSRSSGSSDSYDPTGAGRKGTVATSDDDRHGEAGRPGSSAGDAEQGAVSEGPHAPNELGVIPVLEFHRFGEQDGRWTISWELFRRTLRELYDEGFRPVNLADVVTGDMQLPRGYIPVVLTFDDGSPEQFVLDRTTGQPDPNSAVGILWEFHRQHPDWALSGTFYINKPAFGEASEEKIRWLFEHGFEVGNHTVSHAPMDRMSPEQARAEVGGLAAWVQRTAPGYRVTTLAYPNGIHASSLPDTVWRGEYDGEQYETKGAVLVGAGPAPSPYSKDWQPRAIPRIQVVDPDVLSNDADRSVVWAGWKSRLAEAGSYYVSDGDPSQVTIPEGLVDELADEYASSVQFAD